MPGRVEIDDVAPVVSCGAYPAKAVVGEVIPVRAAVWREGHDAVAATLVVRYLGPRYPQVGETRRLKAVQAPAKASSVAEPAADPVVRVKPLHVPMTPGVEPFVFHGSLHSGRRRAVDLSGGRLGRSDPHLAARRRGQTGRRPGRDRAVQRSAGRGAAAGACGGRSAPRPARAAAEGRGRAADSRRSGSTRRAGVDPRDRRTPDAVSAARAGHPRRAVRGVGRPSAGPLRVLVRDVPALDRRLGRQRQPGARHLRHRGGGAATHRADGLRRGVPAADPSDRQGAPQGPQQHRHGRAR